MANTSVKTFKSTDAGAPVLNGAVGALIALLDACLINGYNLKTAASVTVASGVATITFSAAHGFAANRVVLVAGAGTAGINGEQRVSAITTNAISFPVTGVADGAVSGTVTVKMAPLGYSKEFSGTNLGAYRSTDLASTSRCYLRIDDTATLNARCGSYETMTDIGNGTGRMPTDSQISGGGYISKSTDTGTSRAWTLIGDGRLFHLNIYNGSQWLIFTWGEFTSWLPGDAYNTILSASSSSSTYSLGGVGLGTDYSTNFTNWAGGVSLQRAADKVSQSLYAGFRSCASGQAGGWFVSGNSGYTPGYPSDVTGGYELFPVYVRSTMASAKSTLRGVMNGVWWCTVDMSNFAQTEQANVPSAPDKVFYIMPVYATGVTGYVAIDMIGPWR